MDTRKLSHVVSLAEHRSYARAAETLGLTQSALTRSIQSLEQELGLRLFDRSRAGVFPTKAGQELALEARELLQRMRTIERNMALLANAEVGDVAFGMGPLPASIILPELLTRIVRDHGGLRVRTRLGGAEQLVSMLKAEELEFAILSKNLVDAETDRLSMHSVGWLKIAALVRPGHPLAGRTVTDDDLKGLPLIGGSTRETPGSIDPGYLPTVTCDNYHVLREVTLRTDAVWITADCLARDAFVALEGVSIAQQIQLVAASLPGRTLSAAARSLIGMTTKLLAQATVQMA
jgi:DNA-binding transcriptional LysR family regulator